MLNLERVAFNLLIFNHALVKKPRDYEVILRVSKIYLLGLLGSMRNVLIKLLLSD